MIRKFYLSRFTPSLDDPETLEAIFVQREKLAARLVELIRESALTGNKHYTLLVGPRGIGKTHMVSLIYHRVLAEADLKDRLRIAWLREEECVASFLDFLQTILGVLQEEYQDEQLEEECEQLRRLSTEEAELRAEQLLLQTVGDGTLLVIVENLDDIFQGLEGQGQEKLRAMIQNHPVFTILATSQSLFGGVSVRTSPFYGFFETHHLRELSFEDAVTMMAKIARHQENEELASLIQTPRGRFRVRAVHHLAGGNPRVYVIFSQLVTCESLDELVEPVLRTLDDLTPYYQDRMRHLSPQQRKIVDYLCQRRHAVSVGEIAQDNRVTNQTASSQLKKLRDMGYVRADQAGRESYYELREPLMRISREVKKLRGEPTRLLVEFLRAWYSRAELNSWARSLHPDAASQRKFLEQAIHLSDHESEDPRVAACYSDLHMHVERCEYATALQVTEELTAIRDDAHDWERRGFCLAALDRHREALMSFDRALEIDPYDPSVWRNRGCILHALGRHEDALGAFKRAIEIDPNHVAAWVSQAYVLEALDRGEESLQSYHRALTLDPKNLRAWYGKAFCLLGMERCHDVLAACDSGLAVDRNDAGMWDLRALAMYGLGRLEESLDSLQEALAIEPRGLDRWGNHGVVLSHLGRWEEALRSFDKWVQLDKTQLNLERSSGRATCLMMLDRWDEGIAILDTALQRLSGTPIPDDAHHIDLVPNVLLQTHDAAKWRKFVSVWLDLFHTYDMMLVLGNAIVDSIRSLVRSSCGNDARKAWCQTWQELGRGYPELEIPLRLLDAAVRYREKPDIRVLLGLPIEERELLKPLLGLRETSEE